MNVVFYSSLIDGFGKVAMVRDAQKVFDEMTERGIVPDSHCYNALAYRCLWEGGNG